MIVFDTDVISYVMKPAPPTGLLRRIAHIESAEQATTSITVGELFYGARRRRRAEQYLVVLRETLLPNIRVLAFDRPSAEIYGELRAALESAGRRLPEPDLRIGSICLAHAATLATGTMKHFERIPDLVAEDWLAPYR